MLLVSCKQSPPTTLVTYEDLLYQQDSYNELFLDKSLKLNPLVRDIFLASFRIHKLVLFF